MSFKRNFLITGAIVASIAGMAKCVDADTKSRAEIDAWNSEVYSLETKAYRKAAGEDRVLSITEARDLLDNLGLEGVVLRENDKIMFRELCSYARAHPIIMINPDVHGIRAEASYEFSLEKLKAYAEEKK